MEFINTLIYFSLTNSLSGKSKVLLTLHALVLIGIEIFAIILVCKSVGLASAACSELVFTLQASSDWHLKVSGENKVAVCAIFLTIRNAYFWNAIDLIVRSVHVYAFNIVFFALFTLKRWVIFFTVINDSRANQIQLVNNIAAFAYFTLTSIRVLIKAVLNCNISISTFSITDIRRVGHPFFFCALETIKSKNVGEIICIKSAVI